MELVGAEDGRVVLTGSAGAIRPGGVGLRISGPASALERPVADDGSFVASLAGRTSDVFWLEVLEPERQTFVAAITGGADGAADGADPGPDGDDDDSPDAVDCAPADPALAGRLCPPGECSPLPEACNGLDDDCDGLTDDEDACACAGDSGCPTGDVCTAGACGPSDPAVDQCLQDDECPRGQTCQDGVCL